MIRQCNVNVVIDCNKRSTLVQTLKAGEATGVSGQGAYENSVLSGQFSCKPKTALKNEVY